MTKLLGLTLTLFTIILLTSCGKSDKEVKEAKEEKEAVVKQKKEQLKTTNEKAIINLSQKYNAVLGWDTLELYTYLYQEMFIDQRKPISFEGELYDITKTDSTYFLKVRNSSWHYNKNYIALISLSRQNFVEFQKILKSNYHTNEGCFVFKVSKIVPASPEIKSDLELNGEDSYSYLDYDFDETLLIFKGELIDFYLNESADKTND
jgi:hypothetical protein